MPNFPESGIKLIVETADAESAVSDLMSQLDDLQGQSYSAEVVVETDSSAIDDLPLDGESVDFTVNETVDVETADETSKGILDAVESLNAKETFKMVVDIAGTALDFLKAFEKFSVEPMLDLEDAVAGVNAQTNNAIPNARELISKIFYSDLGDSIDQVGNLVIKAAQIQAPIEEAVTAALRFTHTFKDQNPQEVLDALNQMVIGKLAPNFTVAGDMMVRAFQTSANRGGDLLTTISNNAVAIHDLGLTGPEALSFIDTGMKAGFKSAQNVLDVLLKIKQNVTNAAGNQTSDVTKTLKQLGIANPAETGEAWSAEFFTAVIDKIKNMPGLSDTDKEALFTNLVGGKQGAKTFSSFLAISPEEAKTIFANLSGAAADAAKEADNSLRGAIDDFSLAAQKAVEDWLSSSAIDLPGKIKALKDGLQAALDTLAKGGTLGEALTVALKPIGFDDEFQGLEKALGDFVIGILQAVATLQDITGHGDQAIGTRTTIEGLAKTQLAFDLSIANPDEVSTAVATATSRGLSSSEVTTQVSNIIDQLVTTATSDTLAQAQVILDEFKKNAPNLQVDYSKSGFDISEAQFALKEGGERLQAALQAGIVVDVSPNLSPDHVIALQDKIDAAFKEAPQPDVVQQLSEQMGLLDTSVGGVHDKAMEAVNPLDKVTDNTRNWTYALTKAEPAADSAAGAIVTVTQSADASVNPLLNAAAALDAITGKANSLSAAADHVAVVQGAANATSTSTSAPASSGSEPSLNKITPEAILQAIQGFLPGAAFSGKSGGNVNTIVNNNNIPNVAVADALGFKQASTLRGMR